jgi:nucleoid-associated protein YgaU
MERRIKLAMAAIALGMLIAGAVRRWAKEEGFSLFGEKPQSAVTQSAIRENEFDARPAAAWNPAEQHAVSPAAAQFPVEQGLAPAEATPAASSLIPALQPSFTPARPPGSEPPKPSRSDSSAPTPAPTPIPAKPAGYYRIQPSDSFWSISQRVYGTGRYFQALYEHNRRVCPQPDRLPAGLTIETPEPHLLERAYPELFR